MFLIKRGSTYYIEYLDNFRSKSKRISTGKKKKAEAARIMEQFARRIPTANDQIVEATPKKKWTIKEFEARYDEYVTAMFSKAYLEIVRQSLKMMERNVKATHMNEISFEAAERFIVKTFSRSPYSASQYLRTLKAAFTRAMDWGYIAQNPFSKVKIPQLPRLLPVFISQAELQPILDKTDTQDLRDIFAMAFYTGMRRGELVNLRWESIDLSASTVKVESTRTFKTKWKKERIIPLNKTMNSLLKRRLDVCGFKASGLVFLTRKGLPYNGEFVGKKFKQAVQAAGVNPKVHLHSLRHSFASNLVQRDVPILIVKELLGHEKLSTTQIYAHVKHENLAEAVRRLD